MGDSFTLKIDGIVGYVSDPGLDEKVHSLQHQGRLEILLIQPQDVARHRLRAVTDKGTECQIIIPREQRLGERYSLAEFRARCCRQDNGAALVKTPPINLLGCAWAGLFLWQLTLARSFRSRHDSGGARRA